MSALDHAIPERFFNDPAKCNAEGTTTPVLGLPVCPQGISAVKAIGIAASQGQKIYTITQAVYQNNPNIVNANLSAHSAATRQAVQNALDIGHEVTIHEAPITQSGWTGAGYTTIDPATGAGGYMIDGGSNGGYLNLIIDGLAALLSIISVVNGLNIASGVLGLILVSGPVAGVFTVAIAAIVLVAAILGGYAGQSAANANIQNILGIAAIGVMSAVGAAITGAVGLGIIGAIALTVLLIYVAELFRQIFLLSIASLNKDEAIYA